MTSKFGTFRSGKTKIRRSGRGVYWGFWPQGFSPYCYFCRHMQMTPVISPKPMEMGYTLFLVWAPVKMCQRYIQWQLFCQVLYGKLQLSQRSSFVPKYSSCILSWDHKTEKKFTIENDLPYREQTLSRSLLGHPVLLKKTRIPRKHFWRNHVKLNFHNLKKWFPA